MTARLIGARGRPKEARPPVWPILPPEVPREFFLRRGVPVEWIDSCQFVDWTRDDSVSPSVVRPEPESRISFQVGWPAPPRSAAELMDAVRLGLQLVLRVEDDFDLGRIAAVVAEADYLTLSNSDAAVNWAAFSDAGPRHLFIGRVREPLPVMPRLVHLAAFGPNSVYALAGPRIVRADLHLEGQMWPRDVGPLGPVENLEIYRAKGLVEVPALSAAEALKVFRLAYFPRFDLAGLAEAVQLEWLSLTRVRELRGFDALAGLPNLAEVNIAGLHEAADWAAIEHLPARRLTVEDNRVIPAEVAVKWRDKHPGWRIARGRGPITL